MLKYLDLPGGSMSGKVVSFKINEEKYAILKKEADEKGLSVGQYVRQKILEEEKDDDEREFTNL
ncbi:plasmid mobilization protein, partial [Streptococcus anginosus]|uniref:plasmid mobilization protein n=1 Tax=Streptococcus anginosus TaxID=1328 RepID=UPI003868E90F